MGRRKSTPVKLATSLENTTLSGRCRTRKKKFCKPAYDVLPPNESNCQFYLGDISFGNTNNILPEVQDKCKVRFIEGEDNEGLQLEFTNNEIVLVTVTNDFSFVKGLIRSRAFAMNFFIQDDNFIARLFISKLPLTAPPNSTANIIKIVFAQTLGIQIDECDGKNENDSKDINELYENIKLAHDKMPNISEISFQHPFLKPKLRPYQEDAVHWMVLRESSSQVTEMFHPLYETVCLKTGIVLYYNKFMGYIDNVKPVVSNLRTGGILADEMGLGKTVEVLACILAHPKSYDDSMPEQNSAGPIQISLENIGKIEDSDDDDDDIPLIKHLQKKNRIKLDNTTILENGNIDKPKKCITPSSCEAASSSVFLENSQDSENDETPLIQLQPRKRHIKPNDSKISENHYVDKPKRLKLSDDWVKGSSKKSATRIALEMWYNNTLTSVSTKLSKSSEIKVQCVCGNTNVKGTVRCVDCFKYQHAQCLGYKKAPGAYRCPQCWEDQPHLESRGTLIVCPFTLRTQWCEEIRKHVKAGLKVLVYEGSKAAASVYPTDLTNYDLVLTTYNILLTEFKLIENTQSVRLRRESRYSVPGSPLSRINWWRLCLDEAQTVEVPHSMISSMAKRLQAHHRWAITGTPITKNISDLYGLIDYLHLSPYNEYDTWRFHLHLPYLSGNSEPMVHFLAQVMWRSSKISVVEQIDIPTQTIKEHTLEFTAIEQYYYKHEHRMSKDSFLEKLRKFDLERPLKSLDKRSLKNLMLPFKSIRNACNHPTATRGRYLGTRKVVSSMQDLLGALIEKVLTDGEENIRAIVSSLNGLAGLHILLQQPLTAIEYYRKVLQLAARFNSEDTKKGLGVDKLQLIHTIHNLAEILEACENVPPTLRDSMLREDCIKLQEGYIEKYVHKNIMAYKESMAVINLVENLQEKYTFLPGQWYSSLIDWVATEDLTAELTARVQTLLDNACSTKLKNLPDERRLLYFVTTWDEDVQQLRIKTIDKLNQLYKYSTENNEKFTVSEELVRLATDCHLRPQETGRKVKNQCLICKVSIQMRQYEAKLFDMTKMGASEDISNRGSWKPTSEELVLKGLLGLARAKEADAECITNGELYFNTLETMKKEFKILRKFWRYIDQLICAHDEINMCKIRLTLKEPTDGTSSSNSKNTTGTDRILKNLSYVMENKLQYINILEEHDMSYQISVLNLEEKRNMEALENLVGTLGYLETLQRQQFAGESPDPCPICKNTLQDHWSILPCGHSYCLDCIQMLMEKTYAHRVQCSICRKLHKVEDVAYIRNGEDTRNQSDVKLKSGNYSTKIEAIIRLILKLKMEENDVKILVFSTWTAVINILKDALRMNDVKVEKIETSNNMQQALKMFKDHTKNVTALLLPINLGSKGLNVIEATHVILVEPLLNPGDELQAIGRVHRIGQTRPTTVHKFIVKNTIEENLHQAISANANNWDENKVTLQQLKDLFTDH